MRVPRNHHILALRSSDFIIYLFILMWIALGTHFVISGTVGKNFAHPALRGSCVFSSPEIFPVIENDCCQMHKYTDNDISSCIDRAVKLYTPPSHSSFRSPNEYLIPFNADPNGASFNGREVIWVFIGDSHVRQVFGSLVWAIRSVRVKYRKQSTGFKWRGVHELAEHLKLGKMHEDIEVRHIDMPLNLYFFWDPFLERIPQVVHRWMNETRRHPSFVLLGTGLHWIKRSVDDPSSPTLVDHMQHVKPFLSDMAKHFPVYMHLIFHIQESGVFDQYKTAYSNGNIDKHNWILTKAMQESGVTVWDAGVALSDVYHKVCSQRHTVTYDKEWNCNDPLHVGYALIDQMTNALLNHVCNVHLNPGHVFC